ncbi:unnamed protein product [Rotaria sp. Silwood1]|nr:unnamed protein product [Rotaria sp. Silwood1]
MNDVLIQQFKAQVITRVRSELLTPGVIHSEELAKANMPPSAMANLPTAQSMQLKAIAAKMNLQFRVKMIMSDFESGLISASKVEFPEVERRGCMFHHMQAMHRQVQQIGLATAYKEPEIPRDVLRQVFSLCLMPKDRVESHYQRLLDTISKYRPKSIRTKLIEFFHYYHDQWLMTVGVDMYVVGDLCIRTNNECEGE